MKSLVRTFFVAALFTTWLMLPVSPPAQADDYWNNHWNWYDNTYVPYYYRNYSSSPGYSNYGSPGYYSPGYSNYYGPGYSNYYGQGYYNNPAYGGYGYTPYRNYYGTPGVGVGRMYGGGSAVNIGGMSFGWR